MAPATPSPLKPTLPSIISLFSPTQRRCQAAHFSRWSPQTPPQKLDDSGTHRWPHRFFSVPLSLSHFGVSTNTIGRSNLQ
jgi:hypothetical protein